MCIRDSWNTTLDGTYTGGEYTYTDPNTEEEIKVTVGTGTRILKQSGKADNKADAERKITAAVAMRLVVVPGIVLTLALLLRDPLGITAEEMPTVVAIFCSPVAVTSAVMVQEMGGDEQLAQQVVAWSSALSMVTIFCFAAGLRAMGVM